MRRSTNELSHVSISESDVGVNSPLKLCVKDLSVSLPIGRHARVHAVRSVSLTVREGERIGIVGESGSGKSVTGRAIAGLLPDIRGVRVGGSIAIDGAEMLGRPASAWDEIRATKVGMVFQDPLTYLNPVMRIGAQVREALPSSVRGRQTRTEVRRVLALAGLNDVEWVETQFPHELSGGMRQRVLIAIALAKNPSLIIADEPTTALDATVQQRVLATLDHSVETLGTSLILITHDFAIAARMTDTLYVMYSGRIVESGPTLSVLQNPQHPYTQALIMSVRSLEDDDIPLFSLSSEVRNELAAGDWTAPPFVHKAMDEVKEERLS